LTTKNVDPWQLRVGAACALMEGHEEHRWSARCVGLRVVRQNCPAPGLPRWNVVDMFPRRRGNGQTTGWLRSRVKTLIAAPEVAKPA